MRLLEAKLDSNGEFEPVFLRQLDSQLAFWAKVKFYSEGAAEKLKPQAEPGVQVDL